MFYSTPCSCKCTFTFVRIDIHDYIGGLQRLNTQRYCVRNCALRGLAHRNFSSQVLTIRALYDAFEIVISRIVTFLKSYRNCLVSLYLRSSFEIVTPGLHLRSQDFCLGGGAPGREICFCKAFTQSTPSNHYAYAKLRGHDSRGHAPDKSTCHSVHYQANYRLGRIIPLNFAKSDSESQVQPVGVRPNTINCIFPITC